MIVIGLTGGIGTGKTTAAEYLRAQGFAHVDADQIGREFTKDGQPMLKKIQEQFGCVDRSSSEGNGLTLNRKALAGVVFKDPEKKEQFDSLIHGEMKTEIDRQIANYREQKNIRGIILDAPLMFETGINDRCDVVMLITADKDVRIGRVVERDETTEEAVEDRIKSQMSDEEKEKFSDFVIDNSGEPEDMYAQIEDVLEYLDV